MQHFNKVFKNLDQFVMVALTFTGASGQIEIDGNVEILSERQKAVAHMLDQRPERNHLVGRQVGPHFKP